MRKPRVADRLRLKQSVPKVGASLTPNLPCPFLRSMLDCVPCATSTTSPKAMKRSAAFSRPHTAMSATLRGSSLCLRLRPTGTARAWKGKGPDISDPFKRPCHLAPVHPWSPGKASWRPRSLRGLQVACRHLARLVVPHEIVRELLALDDVLHAGTLDSGDVDERVSAAVVGLDETKALGGVEPLHSTCVHDDPFQSVMVEPPAQATCLPVSDDRCWKRKSSPEGAQRLRKTKSAVKIDTLEIGPK